MAGQPNAAYRLGRVAMRGRCLVVGVLGGAVVVTSGASVQVVLGPAIAAAGMSDPFVDGRP